MCHIPEWITNSSHLFIVSKKKKTFIINLNKVCVGKHSIPLGAEHIIVSQTKIS